MLSGWTEEYTLLDPGLTLGVELNYSGQLLALRTECCPCCWELVHLACRFFTTPTHDTKLLYDKHNSSRVEEPRPVEEEYLIFILKRVTQF